MQNYFETAPRPLLATDFDYFRIPSTKWELMLSRLKQLGLNLVTIAMPWGFHEFNQGTIDLNGATNSRRDLKEVLNLCHTLKLNCILSPGPYHDGGVLGDGLPFWLLTNKDTLDTTLPTAAESWFKALSKSLTGYQWPDGPIIALQVTSEPVASQQAGLSQQLTEVKWRIWLRKRYDGIEALNAAYSADYHTVNDVKFPQNWAAASTPQEKDAIEFLARVERDRQHHYAQILAEAGWQVPIYPTVIDLYPDLPALQARPLAEVDLPAELNPDNRLLNLRGPIQIEPEPIEVGQAPTWADKAPIRADGSVRRSFWQVRQRLWSAAMDKAATTETTLVVTFDGATLATCTNDTSLKFKLPTGTKPATAFRLRLNGELLLLDTLTVTRGKINASYQTEDEIDQTDLLLLLSKPTKPLNDFPRAYLANLLAAQTQTLTRCAALAGRLGQMLAPPQAVSGTPTAPPPAQTLTTLEEARRGLREADAALRKAINSIGGLEHGFATILDKNQVAAIPQPAAVAAAITPEIFEGPAKDILTEIGGVCLELVPQLNTAAAALQQTLEAADSFTIEQYRQGYVTAVDTAQAVRQPLLKIISNLRLELCSEKLPLVLWSIHDQVQEIAETLRWGVLRG